VQLWVKVRRTEILSTEKEAGAGVRRAQQNAPWPCTWSTLCILLLYPFKVASSNSSPISYSSNTPIPRRIDQGQLISEGKESIGFFRYGADEGSTSEAAKWDLRKQLWKKKKKVNLNLQGCVELGTSCTVLWSLPLFTLMSNNLLPQHVKKKITKQYLNIVLLYWSRYCWYWQSLPTNWGQTIWTFNSTIPSVPEPASESKAHHLPLAWSCQWTY